MAMAAIRAPLGRFVLDTGTSRPPALVSRIGPAVNPGQSDHRAGRWDRIVRCTAATAGDPHNSPMTDLDYGAFNALTFDCYGTLIDWESGILAALRSVPALAGVDGELLLDEYSNAEAALEAGPYRRYREIAGEAMAIVARAHGGEPSPGEVARLGGSVVDWPAFSDSHAALARLKTRFRLGVLTNCDDDLFAASNRRLGIAFDWVVTAQQVG